MQGSVQESTRTSPQRVYLQYHRLGDAAMGHGPHLGTLGAADAPHGSQ